MECFHHNSKSKTHFQIKPKPLESKQNYLKFSCLHQRPTLYLSISVFISNSGKVVLKFIKIHCDLHAVIWPWLKFYKLFWCQTNGIRRITQLSKTCMFTTKINSVPINTSFHFKFGESCAEIHKNSLWPTCSNLTITQVL